MSGHDLQRRFSAALAAVRDCAEQMENSADRLLQALSTVPITRFCAQPRSRRVRD